MKYELLKKLESAGFPIVEHADRGEEERNYGINRGKTSLDIVYIPTLGELIEACGEGLGLIINNGDGEWIVRGGKEEMELYDDSSWQFNFKGSTLEEALAMLWLALQELKKDYD